jgi:hypothetical protein
MHDVQFEFRFGEKQVVIFQTPLNFAAPMRKHWAKVCPPGDASRDAAATASEVGEIKRK